MSTSTTAEAATLGLQESMDAEGVRSTNEPEPKPTSSQIQVWKMIRRVPQLPVEILHIICKDLNRKWLKFFRLMHKDSRLATVATEKLFRHGSLIFGGKSSSCTTSKNFHNHLMRDHIKKLTLHPSVYPGLTDEEVGLKTAANIDECLKGVESLVFLDSWKALDKVLENMTLKVKRIKYGYQRYYLSYHQEAGSTHETYDLVLNYTETAETRKLSRHFRPGVRWTDSHSSRRLAKCPTHFTHKHYTLRNLTIHGLCPRTYDLVELLTHNGRQLRSFRLENATLGMELYEGLHGQYCCPFWKLLDGIRYRWRAEHDESKGQQLKVDFINVSKLGWDGAVTLYHAELDTWCSNVFYDKRGHYDAVITQELGKLTLPADHYVTETINNIEPDLNTMDREALVLKYKQTQYSEYGVEGPRPVWQIIKSGTSRKPGVIISGIFPNVTTTYVVISMVQRLDDDTSDAETDELESD